MRPILTRILMILKRYRWIILILLVIMISIIWISLIEGKNEDTLQYSFLPTCPADLKEVVTHPIMDIGTIKGLVPLGNSNPPGHTFPVDHIYFAGDRDGTKHSVYAAGDGMLLEASDITGYSSDGSVRSRNVTVSIAYCKGVELVNAIPGGFSPMILEALRGKTPECKEVPGKHEGEAKITFCNYNDLRIPVKADVVVAITSGDDFPEIWALDKNKELSKEVDWKRYNSPYYQYAFCFFDMYPEDLKDYYYSLFGLYQDSRDPIKDLQPTFIPRTIEPRCGEVNQNITGTIKGDWFRTGGKSGQGYTEGADDLALIRDNIDPTYEKFVIGGSITDPVVLTFLPKHEGRINREFSEVKDDGNTYCYFVSNDKNQKDGHIQGEWSGRGKIVLQLTDKNHLKIEMQQGVCTGDEELMQPLKYDR